MGMWALPCCIMATQILIPLPLVHGFRCLVCCCRLIQQHRIRSSSATSYHCAMHPTGLNQTYLNRSAGHPGAPT